MTRRLHRLRLASLEAVAPPEPVPGGPTMGDLLAAAPDPDERQRLASALAEFVALDARRATLTDTERDRAAHLAVVLHRGLFERLE